MHVFPSTTNRIRIEYYSYHYLLTVGPHYSRSLNVVSMFFNHKKQHSQISECTHSCQGYKCNLADLDLGGNICFLMFSIVRVEKKVLQTHD